MSLGGYVLHTSGVVDDGAYATIGRIEWMLGPATTMLKGTKHQKMQYCNISTCTCFNAVPLQFPLSANRAGGAQYRLKY